MTFRNVSLHPLRIGLLTPYGGTNLGDGAIQTAIIDGLQQHLPGVELWGITLNPVNTTKLHGIPALPITGLRVSFYSETLFNPIDGLFCKFSKEQQSKTNENFKESNLSIERTPKQLRDHFKELPIIGIILKRLVNILRSFFVITHEIAYLFKSYKFTGELDAIIVSGGGQLDELWGGAWGHPYALFRWAILTKLARKQFIVVSVGVGELNTTWGRLLTKTALSLASYRSYRDLVSKKLLQSWSFTLDDPCIPDLAIGLRVSKNNLKLPSGKRRIVVGVSPIAFGHETNWPTPDNEIYKSYVSKLAEFVSELISLEYQIVFFTSSGTDRKVVIDLQEKILPTSPIFTNNKISIPIVDTVDRLIQNVSGVDFVIASRLHSTILSHILLKPVLAISFDRKVDTHMEDMGQTEYLLNIRDFTNTDLSSKFKLMVSNAEGIQKKIKENLVEPKRCLESQYKLLASLINNEN